MNVDIKHQRYLVNRIVWLIKLRWIAATCVLLTIMTVQLVIKVSIPVFSLYSVAVFLFIYNFLLLRILSRIKHKLFGIPSAINRFANIQISIDLTCLAALIHYSGGIENPFIFYFIFHIIIASILLTRRAAFFQATYAVVLILLIVGLEYFRVIPHHCLIGAIPSCLNKAGLYITGKLGALVSTLYISAYFASSISNQLRERDENLKVANKLLNENDQIKSKYVLRVTHDIKEDLSAIHSCIDPVTGGILGPLNKDQENMLVRAKNRSSRLIVYINALLDITKLKLIKRLQMEIFNLREVIDIISSHVKPGTENKHIKFTAQIDPTLKNIKGVRVYIHESILNILMNSIKYTPAGGKINLKIDKNADMLLIVVKDTGIGIPKEDLPKVFDEFYRANNARELEKQGTGLGLSMAKQIIEMHNGRIWIESEEGKGTTIFVELPAVTE